MLISVQHFQCVQTNPQNYHTFVGVLQQKRAYYEHTLNQLQKIYKAIQGKYFETGLVKT